MIRVSDVMSKAVGTCYEWDTLESAAQVLWDSDVGCVVVIDGRRRPIAVLTDRDLAMAAYTQGIALRQGSVSSAMSQDVITTRPNVTTAEAELEMQKHQLHRLPVVDEERQLIGIVSFSDIARSVAADPSLWPTAASSLRTLAAIVTPRIRPALARENGERDSVDEASWESFPASDPPSF